MPREDRTWIGRLTASEQTALAQSEEFFQKPDSRLRKNLSRLGRPFEYLLKATPKGFQKKLTGALHGVLTTVASGAEAGQYQASLVDELCAKSGLELDPWERVFTIDLKVVEAVSQDRIRSAKRYAVLQGGLTGLGGAAGLLADIPTLYYLMFRTVHQIALAFGHPADSDAERMYLLSVVNAGHYLEWRERRCALLELDHLEEAANSKSSSEDLQRTLLAKSVQGLAKKLAATLAQRKAAQTVALVGGAVGAAINRQLIEDVTAAAFHAYRRRFLRSVADLREAEQQRPQSRL